jgi:acetyl esterase/lipase
MRGLFPAVVALALLPGCSRISLLNALSPRAGVTEAHDIAYAPGERHSLDIYAPTPRARARVAGVPAADSSEGSSGRPGGTGALPERGAPVVVFFHGGGWQEGDKAMFRFVGAILAARGYVTVIPNYRLYPAVRFPAFVEDAAAAVAWTRGNVARHGGDPHRIFLMGHSAGAYLAAMLTLDRQWLAAEGLDADRDIAGMIGLAGPYDFLPLHDRRLEEIFAPAGDLSRSQPISFARGDAPPILLASGAGDSVVRPGNTERLAAAIRGDGGQVEEKRYRVVGHSLILGCLVWPLRWAAPVLHDVTGFVDRYAGRANATGGPVPWPSPARAGVAAAEGVPR